MAKRTAAKHRGAPEGKATAVCAQRAKGVGSFNLHVKLVASSTHASHNTCVMSAPLRCMCSSSRVVTQMLPGHMEEDS